MSLYRSVSRIEEMPSGSDSAAAVAMVRFFEYKWDEVQVHQGRDSCEEDQA